MNLRFLRAGLRSLAAVSLAILGMALLAMGVSQASTIAIDTLLTNPSFEIGTAGNCPTSWTCGGSPVPGFAEYSPTSAQYTPGSDGLLSGSVPNGKNAASSPTIF